MNPSYTNPNNPHLVNAIFNENQNENKNINAPNLSNDDKIQEQVYKKCIILLI